jgi:hypothetical protein
MFMKKISLFVATLLLAVSLHASSVFVSENPTANKVMVPLFNSGKTIPLSDFMKLTPSEYKTMTGTKLSFKEKISLKLFQRHFKNAINNDGSVNLEKFHQDEDDMSSFHFGWFALGFFLGLIGLIIALVISDDKRQGRIKWTAIGLGAAIVLSLLFLL